MNDEDCRLIIENVTETFNGDWEIENEASRILELIFEKNKKVKDKASLVEDVRRVIRASIGNRAKEGLLVDFINQTDFDQISDKANVIEAFFQFAQAEQLRESKALISRPCKILLAQ